MTAALAAAVVVYGLTLPPQRSKLASSVNDGTVRGLLHVHSRLSDGRGSREEIAAAAARSGLKFIVLTDHGTGTRRPEPPQYLSGVLVLDGVEISTRGGHYVAIGLPKTPYPLGGESRDVVEDVRRLGGFGIMAHPDSPKSELAWSDWSLPADGLELINPDSSWRVHAFQRGIGAKVLLLRSLLAYPVRPAESIAALLTDTDALTRRWIELAGSRPLVGVAGADAHAKLAVRDREPGDNSFTIPIPSYDASFDTLSMHVAVDPSEAWGADAGRDAEALMRGLRSGHVFVAVDGWATPASFVFDGVSAGRTVHMGDTLNASAPMTLRVRSNAPPGARVLLRRDQTVIAERSEAEFDLDVGTAPGVYTAMVRLDSRVEGPPWVVANPIYVRAATSAGAQDRDDARPTTRRDGVSAAGTSAVQSVRSLFDGRTLAGWSPEYDSTSGALVDLVPLVNGARVRLRYGLAGGGAVGQYSAAAVSTESGVGGATGLSVSLRADVPIRISVQVRAEVAGAAPERWQRSVYVDVQEAERIIRFADMRPVGETHTPTPPPDSVRTIMFVLDTTNSAPGASGQLWIGNPRLIRD